MKENIIGAIAIVAFVGVLWVGYTLGPVHSNGASNFGTTLAGGMLAENYIPYVLYNGGYNSAKDLNITGSTTLGTSGISIAQFQPGGICNAQQKSTGSLAASTSGQFYCAATGVNVGDRVLVFLPVGAGANADGAGSISNGFVAHTGNATTSNWIQFDIDNFTGAATSSFAQATTGVQYYVVR